MLVKRRIRGTWPRPDHGPYFSLGRWGLLVNVFAVVYGAVIAVNIAWPRSAVYDSLAGTKDAAGHVIPGHWYWQYIAILFIGITFIVGAIYYFAVYNRKPIRCWPSTGPRSRPSPVSRSAKPPRDRWR